jgi:peptidoglycan/LPS O-acetylase OafA/YrhL
VRADHLAPCPTVNGLRSCGSGGDRHRGDPAPLRGSFRTAYLDVQDLVVQDVFLLAAFFALRGVPLPDTVSRVVAFLGRESFVLYLCRSLVFYGLLFVLHLDASAGWPAGVGVLVATIGLSLAAGLLLESLPRLRSALFPTGWTDFRSAFTTGRSSSRDRRIAASRSTRP